MADVTESWYVQTIPDATRVPDGMVLVHNHVRPARRQGERGFRFWLQVASGRLEPCECGWAPEAGGHYRMRRGR
jgi:hypothetical protein